MMPSAVSYRDPHSTVEVHEDGVSRYLGAEAARAYEAAANSGLLGALQNSGQLIDTIRVSAHELQHPLLPFISYPYEWSFDMLRAVGLLHLEVLETALEFGFTLKDGTPYNVQFVGPRPVFIDVGSFVPRPSGQPWMGYSQFCRLILNPLLLEASTGVPFQPWLRGRLTGIGPEEIAALLPWHKKMRPAVFAHTVLHSWLQDSSDGWQPPVSGSSTLKLIRGLRRLLEGLKSPGPKAVYSAETYEPVARMAKRAFITYVLNGRYRMVWDMGCSTGEYSRMAAHQCGMMVAMDNNSRAIDQLYSGMGQENILPLVIDLSDPSASRGWAQAEHKGITERGPADMVLALALVHHLRITAGVPLRLIVEWLAKVARELVVEWVPGEDAGVQALLAHRENVFADYCQAVFEHEVERHFTIERRYPLPQSLRVLYYGRRLD